MIFCSFRSSPFFPRLNGSRWKSRPWPSVAGFLTYCLLTQKPFLLASRLDILFQIINRENPDFFHNFFLRMTRKIIALTNFRPSLRRMPSTMCSAHNLRLFISSPLISNPVSCWQGDFHSLQGTTIALIPYPRIFPQRPQVHHEST
jgi:hypothetical protein